MGFLKIFRDFPEKKNPLSGGGVCSIEGDELLGEAVDQHRPFAAEFGRFSHRFVLDGALDRLPLLRLAGFAAFDEVDHILPCLLRAIDLAEGEGIGEIHPEVMADQGIEFFVHLLQGGEIAGIPDQIAAADQIVVFLADDVVLHRLAIPADEIAIEGKMEICEMTDMEHRGIDHVVVFIGAMLGELGAGSADDFGLIHRRMESDVVFDPKVTFDLFKFERLVWFEVMVEMDSGGTMLPTLPIDIIHED